VTVADDDVAPVACQHDPLIASFPPLLRSCREGKRGPEPRRSSVSHEEIHEQYAEQADNAKAHWKPLSWLGALRPTTANDAWDQPLWETFVCTTLGLEVPVLASLPRRNQRAPALCGCKKHGMDLYGDHTSTCTAHSGLTKAHDWAVGVQGPLFRSAGHVVRSQHHVTASAGKRRGDVEVRNYLHDAAGSRSLVFDLSITHDRFGASTHVQQNGSLTQN